MNKGRTDPKSDQTDFHGLACGPFRMQANRQTYTGIQTVIGGRRDCGLESREAELICQSSRYYSYFLFAPMYTEGVLR